MKRAFVVGRLCGSRTMLVLLEPAGGEMPGPWKVEAVVSC